MRKTQEQLLQDYEPIAETRSSGAFMPDGSWNERCGLEGRGPVHRLVTALCRERRAGKLAPEGAARAAEAANAVTAFPSHTQWADCRLWHAAWTQTAAEEAVKRAGMGFVGHWCGQHYASGGEADCLEPRHRQNPHRQGLAELMAQLKDRLEG